MYEKKYRNLSRLVAQASTYGREKMLNKKSIIINLNQNKRKVGKDRI